MADAFPWGLVGVGLAAGVAVFALAAAGDGDVTTGVARAGGFVRQSLTPDVPMGRFFSLSEFTRSGEAQSRGLDNTPTPEAAANLRSLVGTVLDPLRERLGRPVRVTSGYRSAAVNKAAGGVATSQHVTGQAVDIKVDGMTADALAAVLIRFGLPFDQLIWYAPERGGHLHVSFNAGGNRREIKHAPAGSGSYVPWSFTNA